MNVSSSSQIDFFRKLVEHANDIITILDPNGAVIYNNPALETALGHSIEDLAGQPVVSFIHADDVPHVQQALQSVVVGSVDVAEAEFRFIDATGQYRHMHAVGRRWSHEGVDGVLVNSRDLTTHRETIDSLARTNELLSKIFDASNNLISISRIETGELLEVNDTYCAALGFRREEVIGRTALELGIWGSEQSRLSVISALKTHGDLSGHETQIFNKRGEGRLIVMDARTLRVGSDMQMLIAAQDITESRQIEEELRQAHKMDAIGQLTGGVAHDFNNLIGITMGNAELLLHRLPAASSYRHHAQQIVAASQRAADLTRQLLAFSRRQPLQPEPTLLHEHLRDMRSLLETTLSENTAIKFNYDLPLGACNVDKGQFESAILNLVLNARDAMPTGGAVEFNLSEISRNGTAYIKLEVVDSGTGMSKEVIGHAFEPFFTTKEQGKGTGLGLSMVFGFVNQSGGRIQINSIVGEGTTVTMQFPRVADRVPASRPATEEIAPSNATATQLALVIEDNVPLRLLVADYLETLGYKVLHADNDQSASTMLDQEPHLDLLVSDILLNGPITGTQIAEQLRQRYADLKVVLMTGFAAEQPTEVANTLLQKPFSRDLFFSAIRGLNQEPAV